MKNIIEVIKDNKGKILKGGLIVIGAAVGLFIVGKVLMAKKAATEGSEETEEGPSDEDGEDNSEEE